ncbi:hypothetical protein DMA11_19685 [Marinilabiliaceae bacterium JC017]|nr:hypothetical protein DMA11_19685 [Marinilabiliaceae bacterium JC017]
MNCNEVKSFFINSDGHLQALPEEIKNHLASCASCARMVEQMTGALEVINHEKLLQPDPFFSTRVMGAIRENKQPLLLRPVGQMAAAVAAVFVGVVLAMATFSYNDYSDEQTLSEVYYLNELHVEPMEMQLLNDLSHEE